MNGQMKKALAAGLMIAGIECLALSGLLLAGGLPAPDLFPIKAWARCASRVLKPLSGEAVSLIVKERVRAASFDPSCYSGHSLRAGFATSATRAGVSTFKIRQQTGHASDAMLSRYVREGELFLGNAAGFLL